MTDYKELSAAMQLADAPISAAEAHGVITGSICANHNDEAGHWLKLILGTNDPVQLKEYGILIKQLISAYSETRQSLGDSDFSHRMLLPDDDASLLDRVEAIADWSRGFVLGLMESGIKHPSSLGGDAGEFMQDMMVISEVTPDQDENLEGQEKSLAELTEYVRIGTRLVYEELNPAFSETASTTTH